MAFFRSSVCSAARHVFFGVSVAAFFLLTAQFMAQLALPGMAMADTNMSAMEIFSRLPVTIFDDTAEGLSDDERNQLVDRGECAYWLVYSESPDHLILLSRPFGETKVTLRVFRGGEHGFVAAIGTSSTPICALELWGLDGAGGLVPVNTPADPPVSDFFDPGYRLPRNLSPAKLFCLTDQGLESRVLFWGQDGLMHILPTREVNYVWKDGIFVKKITRVPQAEADSTGARQLID